MSWPYAYTPYIWPMLASTIFMAGLAVYAWKHRTVPGAGPFAVQMLFSALWALFTAIEIAATAEPAKIFWYKLGRMTAPPALICLRVMLHATTRALRNKLRKLNLNRSKPHWRVKGNWCSSANQG